MTVTGTALSALAGELVDGALVTGDDVLTGYRQDMARDPDAAAPLALVRVSSTADVCAVMRWATRHHVPVVPRGAGSGLSGGATALVGASG